MKTKPLEYHCSNGVSEFKEAKHEPYEICTETCACETTPRVSEIYCTHGYRMDYKDHHRENAILKITKFDEENRVLFLMSLITLTKPATFDDNENVNSSPVGIRNGYLPNTI